LKIGRSHIYLGMGSVADRRAEGRSDYLRSLWDRIAATPETIPVVDWHREILDERGVDRRS
jgi:hypothetical protein